MLEHGGNLRDAVKQFGRPLEDWVDVSTGINPHYYPAPVLAANAWHRLPEYSDDLQHAAQAYYRAPHMLAVAGTQAAIQALPYLFLRQHGGPDTAATNVRVAVSAPSYAEHAYQWRRAGTSVSEYLYADLENAIAQSDVVVLCNPNNPTGERIAPATLLRWAATLAPRGGWLIVDEAFGDTEPELSVAAESQRPGLIVLRSVGKFFGLAGIRLGFVAAAEDLLHALANQLGPWSISGPAQQIAIAALRDHAWQQATQARLATLGERLR
ncbi:MAG: aminotransferase class I/II-fold pyridoxal phosphate-dependent enzyme, partial [Burkholderiales bacterium]|nr:aminotransferase class I/II-fold pyridoxal phosphate-dependent enzyme [Burkholderiales bacterium]